MSLSTDVIRLVVGMLIGMVLPRIPLLFFTRFLNMEQELPPHPDPVPIGIPLVQRLLLMRRIHIMCWITATLPLALGLWILQNSPEPFAFGMVAGVSWFAISRIVPEDIGQGFGILPMSVIKSVNNLREPETDCCKEEDFYWEVRSIRCKQCRFIALEHPRPDLGRMRSDGRLKGSLRVLLMDGRSIFPPSDSLVVSEGPKLLSKVTEEE